MSAERLTDKAYWASGYAARSGSAPLSSTLGDFRQFSDRKVVEKIESLGLPGRSVLEVGAGDSAFLSYLAARYGGVARFSGLDYSERGCQMLAQRAKREGVEIAVYCMDLFTPPAGLFAQFDVVYSLGVVEHFASLSGVLRAMSAFLAPRGQMLTIIPNMAGLLGTLARRYNRAVYDAHVPHDRRSFIDGHVEAGLVVEASGYVCSTNFGMLSSCFGSESDRGWQTSLWLSRFSKAAWFFESRVTELPHTAWLSPYIYAVSHSVSPS